VVSFSRGLTGDGHLGGVVSLFVGVGVGGVVYVAAALLLGVREMHDVVGMVRRRLGRA
jgi:small basic protein